MAPGDFGQYKLPPAHLRFRTALMAPMELLSREVYYDTSFIQMRRLYQRRDAKGATIPEAELFDYETGLPDIGWRTYLGTDLCTRVDAQEGQETKLAVFSLRRAMTHPIRIACARPRPMLTDSRMGRVDNGLLSLLATFFDCSTLNSSLILCPYSFLNLIKLLANLVKAS